MAIGRFLGVDLAWREDEPTRRANESGVAALDPSGVVLAAGWTRRAGPDRRVGAIGGR